MVVEEERVERAVTIRVTMSTIERDLHIRPLVVHSDRESTLGPNHVWSHITQGHVKHMDWLAYIEVL